MKSVIGNSDPLIVFLRKKNFKIGEPILVLESNKLQLHSVFSSIVYPGRRSRRELESALHTAIGVYSQTYGVSPLYFLKRHPKPDHLILEIHDERRLK